MEFAGSKGWAAFYGHHSGSALSAMDRRQLRECDAYVLALGYQSLTIHAVDPQDGSDVVELACTGKRGESWVTWMFVRTGNLVFAWSALTGAHAGSFASMAEAVRCVLLRDPSQKHAP